MRRTVRALRRATSSRVIHDVGRRIAELRRERGFTQEELAEKCGHTVGYLRRVESGVNLTLESLVQFANVLGVAVPKLFDAPADRSVRIGRPRATPKRHS